MTLCDLCLGLHPEGHQYQHHQSFRELHLCGITCELCQLIADVLEEDGNRKDAEGYRISHAGTLKPVNDTSITISANRHTLRKGDEEKHVPYHLVVSCGPLLRETTFNPEQSFNAPTSVLGIYAEEGSAAAQIIPTRPVPASCVSEASVQLMRRWIAGCAKNHHECQLGFMDGKNDVAARTVTEMTERLKLLSPEETAPLPNRVIDVAAGNQHEGICLVESQRCPGSYAALSHCWGATQHLVTTKATLNDRIRNVSYDKLPKTFQDAVIVTRKLGIKYLWIDSLCIVQDDLKDWETESALMGEVYRNAKVTIAAASAADGNAGFLDDRTSSALSSIAMPLLPSNDTHFKAFWFVHRSRGNYLQSVWKGPLQQRAWTLQERCLSRRILHFTTEQIYFECNRSLQFEDRRPAQEHSSDYLSFATLYFTAMQNDPIHQLLMKAMLVRQWIILVESFTARGMTKEEDALPALSGIATHLSKVCRTEYAAALWPGTNFTNLLLWRVMPYDEKRQNMRPASYRAPSWSWVSIRGQVLFATSPGMQPVEHGHDSRMVADEGIQVEVKASGRDPNGRLGSGKLTLAGWMFQIRNLGTLKNKKFDSEDYGHWASWLGRKSLLKSPHVVLTGYNYVKSFDKKFWGVAAFDDGDIENVDVFALLLLRKGEPGKLEQSELGNDEYLASYLVLYLSPTGNTGGYQRIGMGQLLQLDPIELGEKQMITIL